jgi:hypothetical protein
MNIKIEYDDLKKKFERLLNFACLAHEGYGTDCPAYSSYDLFKVLRGERNDIEIMDNIRKQILEELEKKILNNTQNDNLSPEDFCHKFMGKRVADVFSELFGFELPEDVRDTSNALDLYLLYKVYLLDLKLRAREDDEYS